MNPFKFLEGYRTTIGSILTGFSYAVQQMGDTGVINDPLSHAIMAILGGVGVILLGTGIGGKLEKNAEKLDSLK